MKNIYKTLLSVLMIVSFLAPTFAFNAQAQIPPEQNPIVIVPGIMGSWNMDVFISSVFISEWDFFPLDHTFDNLLQAFEDEGYVRDENLFVTFYDWRNPNAESANDYLIPKIDEALANSTSGKVDIIAHSMGGLVARSYIQSDSYRDDVGQFIMLGTPNYGSSDVYSLWEGGLIPKNWDKVLKHGLRFYLWYMTTATSQTADFYDTIHQYMPSVGELLPTYDYLTDASSGTLKPVGDMIEQNPLLNTLNTEDEIIGMLSGDVEYVTVIAGTGENTVNGISVVPFATTSPQDAKLWVDGIPEPNPPAKNDTIGDNRVLELSAFLPESFLSPPPYEVILMQNDSPKWLSWIQNFTPKVLAFDVIFSFFNIYQVTIESKHGDLPSDGIDEIFDTLNLNQPLQFTPIPEPAELFSIWIASPVAVVVTDSNGNIVSKDENNIPGAIYDGESDPAGVKMIIIPNPQDGDYEVSLTGISGGGQYHMAASHFSDTRDDTINTVEGTAEQDENINYTITLDSSAPTEPITIVINEQEVSEKMSVCEMTEALIADIQLSQGQSLGKDKVAKHLIKRSQKILKNCKKFEEKIEKIEERNKKHKEKRLEREYKKFERKTIHDLKKIIREIKKAKHKNRIDEYIADDLIQKVEEIIEEIKEE